jgi:hypothetical protein
MIQTLTPISEKVPVPKYRFSEPRRNLRTYTGRASAEDRFTIAFARAYWNQFKQVHSRTTADQLSLVREIPVNGYGITDLLAISWAQPKQPFTDLEEFISHHKPTIRAFEMKLGSWRAAMSQASRYKNFAHQAIAVLPVSEGEKACEYLETFQKIRVGLWTFDPQTASIKAIYTPRPRKPRSHRYHLEAFHKAAPIAKPALPVV